MKIDPLDQYKHYVRSVVQDITHVLIRIQAHSPEAEEELQGAVGICEDLLGNESTGGSKQDLPSEENKNMMMGTMRMVPRIESLILPSQNSFYQIN